MLHIHCPPKVWKHPWQSVVLDDISINPYHFLVQILYIKVTWHYHWRPAIIDMPLCQLWCLVTGLNWAQVFKRFLGQHTVIASTIDCQLSLEYNEPIRTQFRSDSLQNLHLKCKFFICINCLCNKICFRSLCCPLSVQNYHKLKRIHANIVQNPTFLGRFQTFGGQCI